MSIGIFYIRVTAAGKVNGKCGSNSDTDYSILLSHFLESVPEPGCQEQALSEQVQRFNAHMCYVLAL